MKESGATNRWLDLARGLMSCPTAPLMEDLPAQHVLSFAAARPKLKATVDRVGNLLVKCPAASGRKAPPLVLVAHTDHPAFWVKAVRGKTVKLVFKGSVRAEHAVKGSKVRFFRRGEKNAVGRGRLTRITKAMGRLTGATAKLESGRVDTSGFAMWDFPGFSVRNGRIISRACDDMLGAAVMLCVLDECARWNANRLGSPVWALFTRAEEIGFFGALTAVKDGLIPKRASVISLECSRALANAPQGAGAIVRVGDLWSVFDPFYTECLTRACMALKKQDKRFQYQRKLMDGGICEATVFCDKGYKASGLALPLGNYHNQAGLDGGAKRMGAESVMVADFAAEVRLLLELIRPGNRLDRLSRILPKALKERCRRAEKAFRQMPPQLNT